MLQLTVFLFNLLRLMEIGSIGLKTIGTSKGSSQSIAPPSVDDVSDEAPVTSCSLTAAPPIGANHHRRITFARLATCILNVERARKKSVSKVNTKPVNGLS